MFSRISRIAAIGSSLIMVLAITNFVRADLLLYEGFDIPIGTLDGNAGITSFGFDPVLGTVWDSGIFASPQVGAGSLSAPTSTAGFYLADSAGNRVTQDFQSSVIQRSTQVSHPHLFGSFLADLQLDGSFITHARINFDNFHLLATNPGSGSTDAFWHIENSGGSFNTGVRAQGESLVLWELMFDQSGSAAPDTMRVWFNRNPLTELPDYESTTFNLGQNNLGGLALNNTIFLGLSRVEFDEFRVGSDWASVGVSAIPEPCSLIPITLLWGAIGGFGRRRG